jgi:hypothetical protein
VIEPPVTPDTLAAWGLEGFLLANPALAIQPSENGHVSIAGHFRFCARAKGVELQDCYQIEMAIPRGFPQVLPQVKEVGGRIPSDFHHYPDGGLCLGSPIRLALIVGKDGTLSRFAEQCIIPYLFACSYKERYGTLPFGELAHGKAGIMDDLLSLLNVGNDRLALHLLQFAGIQRRKANRRPCPCGGGLRVGRCHHRLLNHLRERLGRLECRTLHLLLADGKARTKQAILRRV